MLPGLRHGSSFARPSGITAPLIHADDGFRLGSETFDRKYERVLALDPVDCRLLGNAASLLNNLGRLEEALVIKEAVVHRDPVNLMAHYDLGNGQRCS